MYLGLLVALTTLVTGIRGSTPQQVATCAAVVIKLYILLVHKSLLFSCGAATIVIEFPVILTCIT